MSELRMLLSESLFNSKCLLPPQPGRNPADRWTGKVALSAVGNVPNPCPSFLPLGFLHCLLTLGSIDGVVKNGC